MSGHSHSKQIKHQKDITDKKRSTLFSKLLNAVSIAARTDPNPNFNPRLRTAIEKAKTGNVPNENIEKAIKKVSEPGTSLEELLLEAYGPEGSAILIIAVTNSRNRTVSEIKNIFTKEGFKWAESGSVLWAFEQNKENFSWQAKFPQEISPASKEKIKSLIEKLEERDDIQSFACNIKI
ncbi:MAG: hypothetical protein A2390_01910 [Candidatus Liptonbacteria bacterium RIFOXYB1_FULL_36_10]|uniref:Transcriptional regulator n=2 Tax=Candidatus Liptoniibacteriota TaxID=1817909 RepID=A0A1G2CMN5_9BACT|nr:MAG: hypothetical protein A2390_01910 [Candidatus Liptonbacteria bacterium RIFOXYB1_FULL_36_10]OGZ03306.1 MAG: hypothetical protein A2604_02995 [Candidatus Liptonbacteria bacterium RIFOXYD1_FULL_36_11]